MMGVGAEKKKGKLFMFRGRLIPRFFISEANFRKNEELVGGRVNGICADFFKLV